MEFINQNLTEFVIIMFCLLASAFFSAAETAITSLGALKAKHLLDSRGKAVKQLELWLKKPNHVLTTILVGNNAVNILASAVATDLASRYFKNQAVGIATGITTLLVLIFGEITPKSFATANSEQIAIPALKIISILQTLLYPIIWSLSKFANFIIHALGSKQHQMKPPITEEELEFLINVGESAGVIGDLKREMISGVFEFDEIKVHEIMTPRTDIVSVEVSAKIDEAINLILDSGHSRLPVYKETIDNIVGILIAKDLLRNAAQPQAKTLTISDLMREAIFTPESKPIHIVFKDLKRTKSHMTIIIDEYGGTAGIVTMEDILEEIVGEIQDEFDVEEAKILEIDNGIYDVAGSVNIKEFIEYFNLKDELNGSSELKEIDVDTIAGWMTHRVGDMPEVGQSTDIGHLHIEISEVDRHRIERLRITEKNAAHGRSSQSAEDQL